MLKNICPDNINMFLFKKAVSLLLQCSYSPKLLYMKEYALRNIS